MSGDRRRELVLEAKGSSAIFDVAAGARLASLVVEGHELLVQPDADPMRWGSYPMVPWAGRIRDGRFTFAGRRHQLPITLPPHAIHGTAYTSEWSDRDGVMVLDLAPPWPFGGTVEQAANLTSTSLTITLKVAAGSETMPAMLGWHPWFRRRVGGAEAALDLDPAEMYELDHEMIPTGSLVEPTAPPWDNCFLLNRHPVIRWPGVLELELRSDCRCWTVYTMPTHALCVEPQTDAPDSFNRQPETLGPDESLTARFELRWSGLA